VTSTPVKAWGPRYGGFPDKDYRKPVQRSGNCSTARRGQPYIHSWSRVPIAIDARRGQPYIHSWSRVPIAIEGLHGLLEPRVPQGTPFDSIGVLPTADQPIKG